MHRYTLDQILEIASQAAKKAGNEIIKTRQAKFEVNFKDRQDLVTCADLASEKVIIELIKANFPEHQILAEESAQDLEQKIDYNKALWVIDPLDGTMNFAHGLNHCAVSIGFFDKGQAQVGVVYAPFNDQFFYAKRGHGAYLNHKKIQVSQTIELEQALIAVGTTTLIKRTKMLESLWTDLGKIVSNCRDIRRLGSAALEICWTSCGLIDGFFERSLSPWDVAAGRLIAQEAGAKISPSKNLPKDPILPEELFCADILIANPILQQKLYNLLNNS